MVILASLPFVGLTQSEKDTKEGLVLDFGYWNTEWDPIEFGDGWDGKTVLEKVCEQKGYESVWLPDGSLYAVNTPDREDPADREHVNLVGMTWRFYVHDGKLMEEYTEPGAGIFPDSALEIGRTDTIEFEIDEEGILTVRTDSGSSEVNTGRRR